MQGFGISAASDLGLGSNLSQQVADETDEEKKKKRLGMSSLQDGAAQALGFGMTGISPMKLS